MRTEAHRWSKQAHMRAGMPGGADPLHRLPGQNLRAVDGPERDQAAAVPAIRPCRCLPPLRACARVMCMLWCILPCSGAVPRPAPRVNESLGWLADACVKRGHAYSR